MSIKPTPSVAIRTFGAGEWQLYRNLRLRALDDSPNAFGALAAEARARPNSSWQERLHSGVASSYDQPLCAHIGDDGVGLAWGGMLPSESERAHLFQMWVSPEHRGKAIGQALLEAVISWAKSLEAEFLELGVTCGNSSASNLYYKAGFSPRGEPEPLRLGSKLLAQRMELRLTAI